MFEIDKQFRLISSLPVITDNYKTLHFNEYPILFSGTNKYGNKLIGSLCYVDEVKDNFRYFNIILDDKEFYSFFNGTKSYLDLINSCNELFVIDKDINNEIINTFQVPLSEIPIDYLPLQESFIPSKKSLSKSLSFSFSLKGKLADVHKSLVNDINSVAEKISSFLETSLELLKDFNLYPQVYSQPSQSGSYRLNFDIEFKSDQSDLFSISNEKVGAFTTSFYEFIANVLPKQRDGYLAANPEELPDFKILKAQLEELYSLGIRKIPSTVGDKLIESINVTAGRLATVSSLLTNNQSFNLIELSNCEPNGHYQPFGLLEKEYFDIIYPKLIEEEVPEAYIISDETNQDYRILVYSFNVESGKGSARLYYKELDEDYVRIKLNVTKGEGQNNFSQFTKSLAEDKVIGVKGIAFRKNGKYIRLDCF